MKNWTHSLDVILVGLGWGLLGASFHWPWSAALGGAIATLAAIYLVKEAGE